MAVAIKRDHDDASKKDDRKLSAKAPSSGAEEKKSNYRMESAETGAMPASPAPVPDTTAFAEKSVREEKGKVAVFVAHGMGQQIPFQTLDQIAEGLRKQDRASGHTSNKLNVRAIKFGEQWLSRIEMGLKSGSADELQVDIYEGYWAPLTEGKITARGVINFLRGAAGNGIKNGSRAFSRWLFGKYWDFDSPIRIVLYLLIALITVLALVLMNSTIAVVAAGRALLADEPAWLTNGLFADLTTTFNAVVTAMAIFGASLGIAMALRKASAGARQIWGWVTVAFFIVVLFVVALAALAIGLLFYGHLKLGTADPAQQLWTEIFSPATIAAFNTTFDTCALWLAIAAGAMFLLMWIFKIFRGVKRDIATPDGRWLTLFVTACGLVLVGLAGWLAFSFWDVFSGLRENETMDVASSGLAWPLLIAASAFIRQILVQYVGDVAIYVAPYKVDGFFQLRNKIKDCVYHVAHAVYALQRKDGSGPEYDKVIVVGHSLGSVVVYDVLNRLVNDDEADGTSLNVARRTPLLLTFGSPLDKTAFLFAVQRHYTDEAREALAATVQPLLQHYRFRPDRWINIYSPWDIISGNLSFYDPPEGKDPKRVHNIVDPGATTLLAAHVEYWNNPILFKTLYDELCG